MNNALTLNRRSSETIAPAIAKENGPIQKWLSRLLAPTRTEATFELTEQEILEDLQYGR